MTPRKAPGGGLPKHFDVVDHNHVEWGVYSKLQGLIDGKHSLELSSEAVRRWNSHAALLAALEALVVAEASRRRQYVPGSELMQDPFIAAWEMARAALAEAKGEA